MYALPVNKVHRSVRSDTCNLLIPKQANISLTVKVEDTGKPLRITALGNPQLRFVVVDPEQKFSCGAKNTVEFFFTSTAQLEIVFMNILIIMCKQYTPCGSFLNGGCHAELRRYLPKARAT